MPDSTEIVKMSGRMRDFVRRGSRFAKVLHRKSLQSSGFQKNFTNLEKSV